MRSVLVVVRDRAVRDVFVGYLHGEGLRVHGVARATAAIEALDAAVADAVAIDAAVIDDGLLDARPAEAVARLRAHRSGAALGIVVLRDPATEERGTDVPHGASALVKPVRLQVLKAALLDACRRGRG